MPAKAAGGNGTSATSVLSTPLSGRLIVTVPPAAFTVKVYVVAMRQMPAATATGTEAVPRLIAELPAPLERAPPELNALLITVGAPPAVCVLTTLP